MNLRGNKAELVVLSLSFAAWLLLMAMSYYLQSPKPPYFLSVLPLAAGMFYFAVQKFEKFLFLMVAMVPMSATLHDIGGGFGAALPAEAMLLIAFGGILLLILSGNFKFSSKFLKHPLFIVIAIQTIWIFITLFSSSFPAISTKFLLARLIYLLVFLLGFGHLSLDGTNAIRFFRQYILGFIPIMIYSLVVLSSSGLSRRYSPIMGEPFFDDHTVLGVCLAILLPMVIWLFRNKALKIRIFKVHNLGTLAVILLPLTLLLTFSRAAWLGVIVIGAFYLIMRLRIGFKWMLMGLAVTAALVYLNRERFEQRMNENNNVSGEDVVSTMGSVTNVSSDDSNLERLNRWACALRMAEERPWLGFGPGTYEKSYGPFQMIHQRTRISTSNGDRGDAHSEYLGALSEQGFPGMIFLVLVFLTSIWTGLRLAYQKDDPMKASFAMAIVLGLVSYYVHGFVNDFLDIDKAATIFWSMLGILIALDVSGNWTNLISPESTILQEEE